MKRRARGATRPTRISLTVGWFSSAIQRAAAATGLVLISPVLVAIVVAVRVSSPGPAVFRQQRIGQYGRTFTIYKFRTMRVGAEAQLAAVLAAEGQNEIRPFAKVKHDPRITPIGAFLRRTSLDELPQLVNVVRGDMNLVGPRPQTPAEAQCYDAAAWRRLLVRPGITGLWQVSGRSDVDPDLGLALDAEYVQTWSPSKDIALLARTFFTLTGQRGAY